MNKGCNALIMILALAIAGGCAEEQNPSFAGSGIVEATEVTVGAKTPGTILEMPVDNGTQVNEGDLIARIDIEQFVLQRKVAEADLAQLDWTEKIQRQNIEGVREQLKQAQDRLELTKKTYERISNLFSQGAATADQFDTVKTELSVNTAAVGAVESQLSGAQTTVSSLAAQRQKISANMDLLDKNIRDGAIIAPVTGEVVDKFVEAGEVVMATAPLCTIADLRTVKLRIYVSEDMLGKIAVRQNVDIAVDSRPGEVFSGTVTWISPKAEFTPKNIQTRESRADLVYAVEISMPNPEGIFRIGMPADAYIAELSR